MNAPKVSVIIPTYNRAQILSRAIKSVLNQTFQDFELIVVDDGSVDNTRQLVVRFQERDSRVNYIWQESSGGVASPRNTGIQHARGAYIAFLDDDDEWMPQKLEKQVALFQSSTKQNLGCVGCSFVDININNGKMAVIQAPKRASMFRKLLEECFLLPSAAVLKREVFSEVGLFDERAVLCEDRDMWIRLAQKYDLHFVDEVLCKRYIHGDNISETFHYEKVIKSLQYLITKHMSCYENYPMSYSKQLRYLGTLYVRAGDIKSARTCFMSSINAAPHYPRSYINLIVSLLGKGVYRKVLGAKRKMARDVRG